MADGYVTNWGNDNNDGLSWETAKRTLQGGVDAGLLPLYLKGYYNELVTLTTLIGDGYAIIDGFGFSQYTALRLTGISMIRADLYLMADGRYANYCFFKSCLRYGWSNTSSTTFNIFLNTSFQHLLTSGAVFNNTFFSYTRYELPIKSTSNLLFSNIFYGYDINTQDINLTYSLFIDCKFKFTNGGLGFDEAVYEFPTGIDDDAKLENLRDRMSIVYGGVTSNYLTGCKYHSGPDTDIFVDPSVEDFSLVPNCIAAHMSFNGDYIGARKEGVKASWNTDFTNITNIGTPGLVLNQNLDAVAESNVIDFSHVRNVTKLHSLGQRAARNGQRINTITDLDSPISAGANVLTNGSVYQCINDVISIDNIATTSYNPWDTFNAVEEGTPGNGTGLGFTGDGEVEEVLIDSYPEKIQIKVSKTDNTVSTATLITCYLHSSPVMVNVDGGGEPTHGDADVGYNEGTAIALYTRYIKYYIKIKAGNLPAR